MFYGISISRVVNEQEGGAFGGCGHDGLDESQTELLDSKESKLKERDKEKLYTQTQNMSKRCRSQVS